MSIIEIKKIGITDLDTDCIVNAANSQLMQGSGVCGAIFRAAGASEMTDACQKIREERGSVATGFAAITPGFALKAKYVIHAVGPIYARGGGNEPAAGALYSAYKESLDLARDNGCHSIGFPLISTGVFGYPKEEAWPIAITACAEWLDANKSWDMEIVFAVIDDATCEMGQTYLQGYRSDELGA